MPRFEYTCGQCGVVFDVVRPIEARGEVRCPSDGTAATLRAIFGDTLEVGPPPPNAGIEAPSRVSAEGLTAFLPPHDHEH